MIAKPFYLLKKILFTNKSQAIKSHFLEKITITTNLKQSKLNPLFYSHPHSNNLISFKTAFVTNKSQTTKPNNQS
ncbi:hypothetical protein BB479_05000 [Helicobacter pylori]|nr:hypothetical protein BB479_05000 [Helicobacter pylori]PDW93871.1 hypothetical protein BB393_02965 [Helicobacter pylori]